MKTTEAYISMLREWVEEKDKFEMRLEDGKYFCAKN